MESLGVICLSLSLRLSQWLWLAPSLPPSSPSNPTPLSPSNLLPLSFPPFIRPACLLLHPASPGGYSMTWLQCSSLDREGQRYSMMLLPLPAPTVMPQLLHMVPVTHAHIHTDTRSLTHTHTHTRIAKSTAVSLPGCDLRLYRATVRGPSSVWSINTVLNTNVIRCSSCLTNGII